jgi:hypothetical protein
MPKSTTDRPTEIPRYATLSVAPERLRRMWSLTPHERQAAAHRGEFSHPELLRWAARYPHEVELVGGVGGVGGEFFFIAALLADVADADE